MSIIPLLLMILFLQSMFSYHINVGSTGLLFPYTLGALAYIKTKIQPQSCKLLGISGGSWCSVLYHLEPNINNPDMLWSIFVGDKNKTISLLERESMVSFQQTVAVNFKDRYKNVNVSDIPVSILVSKVNDRNIESIKIEKFENIDDLVEYCLCTSYIPYISGNKFYKTYKNNKYIDGEILKNKKLLFKNPHLNLNKYTWNTKYYYRHSLLLDLDGCKYLFEKGWQDAKDNL